MDVDLNIRIKFMNHSKNAIGLMGWNKHIYPQQWKNN